MLLLKKGLIIKMMIIRSYANVAVSISPADSARVVTAEIDTNAVEAQSESLSYSRRKPFLY